MFKSRKQIAEEEAKREENYIPTKDLMSDEDRENGGKVKLSIPWTPVIIMGVLAILIVVCIIVILSTGGPVN